MTEIGSINLFLDDRIKEILETPPEMWGGCAAVEAQILLLLETKLFIQNSKSPQREIIKQYKLFLKQEFSDLHNSPLFILEPDEKRFMETLTRFVYET